MNKRTAKYNRNGSSSCLPSPLPSPLEEFYITPKFSLSLKRLKKTRKGLEEARTV